MSEPEPVRDEIEEDDDFTVWPFRRQLVDPLSRGHQPVVVPPPSPRPRADDTQPFGPLWVPPQPRRRAPAPARLAIPLALATFFAAIAGTAAITNAHHVQSELKAQIEPAAQAAPKRRAVVLAPVHRRARPALFVPDVVGLARKAAVKQLRLKKFHVRVRLADGPPDTVIEQKPRAGTEVRRAGKVLLLVGRVHPKPKPKPEPKPEPTTSEPAPVAAPPPTAAVIVAGVVGLSRDDATRTLTNEGLQPVVVGVPSSRPAGTVVAQAPAGGSRVDAGSSARVNVSVGRTAGRS